MRWTWTLINKVKERTFPFASYVRKPDSILILLLLYNISLHVNIEYFMYYTN